MIYSSGFSVERQKEKTMKLSDVLRAKKRNEQTSKKVGSLASALLRSPNVPKGVKSVAASALTQRPGRKKGK